MSSRLLTMKVSSLHLIFTCDEILLSKQFMQRAAASAAINESSQPPSDTPSPKRSRTDQDQAPTPQSDLDAISAALAEEENRRREAVSKQAAESGETEWVLDFDAPQHAPAPRVVTADSLDADDSNMVYGGRQKYGNFKRKKTITVCQLPFL